MKSEERYTMIALLSALVGTWFAALTILIRWLS